MMRTHAYRTMKAPYLIVTLTLLLFSVSARAQLPALEIFTVVPAVANTTVPDQDGDFPAYIVLRANTTVTLAGLYLTDEIANPAKWQFPDGYVLTTGQTLSLFASGKDRRPPGPDGELHTNFYYDCSVPYCSLRSANQESLDVFRDLNNYCECDGLTLIRRGAKAEYLVPGEQDTGTSWTLPSFDPSSPPWQSGPTSIGYDVGENTLCDGLILYATMDTADISGSTVKDVSGPTVHDGTMTGGTLPIVTAKIKEGLEFNNEPNPHVDFGAHAELSPGSGKDFSGSIWVRSRTSPAQGQIQMIASNEGFNKPGWSILRANINLGAVAIRTVVQFEDAGGNRYQALLPALQNSVWQHVAFSYTGSSGSPVLQAYFNGIPVTPVSIPSGSSFASSGKLLLGRDGPGQYGLSGDADDFALWDRALTGSEITELYNAGNQGLSFKDPSAGIGSLYDPLIATDVEMEMRGINSSLYVRVPFYLSSFPTSANKMLLRMNYDDGFQAYLNGKPVAARRIPSILNWNSKAISDRFDPLALAPETIDITPDIGALKQGVNVLAIHALNADANADRFLICPELCVELRPPGGGGQDDDCVKSTNGREFWLAFPENWEEEPDYPPEPSVCITGPRGTSGTVAVPGISFTSAFTIPSGKGTHSCVTVVLPKGAELEGDNDIENKAVIVKANADVAVYGQNRIDYTTDRYLGVPLHCLGTNYMVLTYKNVQTNVPLIQGTQLAIVAPYDDTDIMITFKDGSSMNVTLNSGETYQFRDEDPSPVDVTGARVKANKPVSVYGSHRCANIQRNDQWFCDHLVEQLFPIGMWGNQYLIAPLETRSGDTLRILAAFNNTQVSIDENGSVSNIILNSGEVHEMTLDVPTRLSSNTRFSVAQFSNSADFDNVPNNHGDPFMVLIQPCDQWMSDYYICAASTDDFAKSYITVISKSTVDLGNTFILIDGASLGSVLTLASNTGTIGTFATGETFARLELPNLSDKETCYHIDGRNPFGLTVYGFDVLDSYGYPGGLCLPDLEGPLISNQTDVTVTTTTGTATVPNFLPDANFADNVTTAANLILSQTPAEGQLGLGTHIITIEAEDEKGNKSTSQITFIVSDENSPPRSILLQPLTPAVNAPESTVDITLGFEDDEQPSDELDYQIVAVLGNTEAFEMIAMDNDTKELIVRCKLNLIGSVDVRVRAIDEGGLSAINSQLINVQGTPYQQWLNATFPKAVLSDPDQQVPQWGEQADGDGDGSPTIGEAFHGTNPNAFNIVPIDTVEFDDGSGEYVFTFKRAVDDQGADGECQWSLNLTEWYQSGEGPPGDPRTITTVPGEIANGQQTFQARISGEGGERIFFQITYQQSP